MNAANTSHDAAPRKRQGRPGQSAPRAGTKQAEIVGMLGRDRGASIRELAERTGWKANTIHSALATLRKGGSRISVDKTEGESRYRMTGDQA